MRVWKGVCDRKKGTRMRTKKSERDIERATEIEKKRERERENTFNVIPTWSEFRGA